MKEELRNVNAEIEKHKRLYNDTLQELQIERKRREDGDDNNSNSEAIINTKTLQLQQLRDSYDALVEEKRIMLQEKADLEMQKDKLVTSNTGLEFEVNELKKYKSEISNVIVQNKKQMDDYKNALAKIKQEYDSYTSEYSVEKIKQLENYYNNQLNALKEENQALKQEKNEIKKQLDNNLNQAEQMKSNYITEVSKKQSEIEGLRNEIGELNNKFGKYQQYSQEEKNSVTNELNLRINQLQNELKQANINYNSTKEQLNASEQSIMQMQMNFKEAEQQYNAMQKEHSLVSEALKNSQGESLEFKRQLEELQRTYEASLNQLEEKLKNNKSIIDQVTSEREAYKQQIMQRENDLNREWGNRIIEQQQKFDKQMKEKEEQYNNSMSKKLKEWEEYEAKLNAQIAATINNTNKPVYQDMMTMTDTSGLDTAFNNGNNVTVTEPEPVKPAIPPPSQQSSSDGVDTTNYIMEAQLNLMDAKRLPETLTLREAAKAVLYNDNANYDDDDYESRRRIKRTRTSYEQNDKLDRISQSINDIREIHIPERNSVVPFDKEAAQRFIDEYMHGNNKNNQDSILPANSDMTIETNNKQQNDNEVKQYADNVDDSYYNMFDVTTENQKADLTKKVNTNVYTQQPVYDQAEVDDEINNYFNPGVDYMAYNLNPLFEDEYQMENELEAY